MKTSTEKSIHVAYRGLHYTARVTFGRVKVSEGGCHPCRRATVHRTWNYTHARHGQRKTKLRYAVCWPGYAPIFHVLVELVYALADAHDSVRHRHELLFRALPGQVLESARLAQVF